METGGTIGRRSHPLGFWNISQFKYALLQGVKRQKSMDNHGTLWQLYTRWAYPNEKWATDSKILTPSVLIDFLRQSGHLPQGEHMLHMMRYYNDKEFVVQEDKEDIQAPGRLHVWKPGYYAQLVEDIKNLQREDKRYPNKLTWGQFHVTFGLHSHDPGLNHPHYLKVFWYHVTGQWWLPEVRWEHNW